MIMPLVFALSPCVAQQSLIHTLVSSFTPGEQLSLEVTPDGKRGFLAEGATIAVLDLELTPPALIATHPMPDCQPLSMRYYAASSGERSLFIAGGALGVWRLSLCPTLFQTPPSACASGYADLLVQAPLEAGYFERKRCVDVEVLETGGGPRLFALFAASSAPNQSTGGPTELRAYTWDSTTATLFASFTFPSASDPVQVGTALAVDPADPNSIYVALGKGGIWRADLDGSLLSATRVWSCSDCGTCPEHVRDLAIVRVDTNPPQSVLYAALNYDELLEIADLGGASTCTRVPLDAAGSSRSPGFSERVAAIANGTNVLVALTAQSEGGKLEDSLGPKNVNSLWSGICLQPGVADPDAPTLLAPHSQAQFYQHEFAPGGGALSFRSLIDYTARDYGDLGWNSAILRPRASGLTDRVFLCSRDVGTEIYDFDLTAGLPLPIGTPFVGDAFRGQDSLTSLINPGVLEFVQESVGAVDHPKQMVYADPHFPYAITPVARTEWSPCRNDYLPPPPDSGCNLDALRDPLLYASSIFEEAHWLDPIGASREYFLAGRRISERFNSQCSPIPDCLLSASPCSAAGDPNWWLRNRISGTPQNPGARNGWRVINLLIPAQGPPVDGPSFDPRWWQIDLPDALATPTQPAESASPTDDRVQSIGDLRTTHGMPNALYLTRSGSSHGVKAVQTSTIVSRAGNSCAGTSPGVGEMLPFAASDYRTTLTHLELELVGGTAGCTPIAPCPGGPAFGKHQLINNHTDMYRTRDLAGRTLWVLAIASGFPAADAGTAAQPQFPGCAWTDKAGLPMLVLVDITQTGDGSHFADPRVLRVALGPQQGHAFCVRTKTYGTTTFAFVGDVLGTLWVFNVTGRTILPLPTSPYLPNTPIVGPVNKLELPRDPFDGLRANCVDLEIVGNYLYCALARLGVGIVDISNPLHPVLIDVMDTPGLVLGLSTRSVVTGTGPATQLIVGDSRCGVRIYQ